MPRLHRSTIRRVLLTLEGVPTLTAAYTRAPMAQLTIPGGTLVNAPTGTIAALPGIAIGTRTLVAGLLGNFGTLNANVSLTLTAPMDQRGTVTVLASRTLTISGLLSLYTGSNTNVLGALVKSGGGTGATCP